MSTTESLAVEVVVMGVVSVVEISHIISTTTFTSITAVSRVMVQVSVSDVPAVRGDGGVVRDTPGVGTVEQRSRYVFAHSY